MSEWRLCITPSRDRPVDDAAREGLEFVDEHETEESALEEGMRVLRALRSVDGGNTWCVLCYRRIPVGNRGVQVIGARYISPEAAD